MSISRQGNWGTEDDTLHSKLLEHEVRPMLCDSLGHWCPLSKGQRLCSLYSVTEHTCAQGWARCKDPQAPWDRGGKTVRMEPLSWSARAWAAGWARAPRVSLVST